MKDIITAGKSILENTMTNCVFIADRLTEETQCKGENRNHIQKVGELDISIYQDVPIDVAVITLIKHLRDDEDYKSTWLANIAMAIKDEYAQGKSAHIYHIADKAAERFINQLIK